MTDVRENPHAANVGANVQSSEAGNNSKSTVTRRPRLSFIDIELIKDGFEVEQLGRYDLLLFLTLATYASHTTGECWPSMSEIRNRSGLDIRAIRSGMRTLEDLGLVQIKRRDRKPSIVRFIRATRDESVPSSDSARDESAPSTRDESVPPLVPIRTQTRDESVLLTNKPENKEREAEPSRYCSFHQPNGPAFGVKCVQCGEARRRHEAWSVKPTPTPPRFDPTPSCAIHPHYPATLLMPCEACKRELQGVAV